jgi:hypothetical protein
MHSHLKECEILSSFNLRNWSISFSSNQCTLHHYDKFRIGLQVEINDYKKYIHAQEKAQGKGK